MSFFGSSKSSRSPAVEAIVENLQELSANADKAEKALSVLKHNSPEHASAAKKAEALIEEATDLLEKAEATVEDMDHSSATEKKLSAIQDEIDDAQKKLDEAKKSISASTHGSTSTHVGGGRRKKRCKNGTRRSRRTKRCQKPCKPGYRRNRKTHRCKPKRT